MNQTRIRAIVERFARQLGDAMAAEVAARIQGQCCDRNLVLHGDALEMLKSVPAGLVQTCVTSPPYWGIRDFGHPGQLGLERTPEEYVARLVAIMGEVRRVMRSDGTLWLNLGDTYRAKRLQGIPWRVVLELQRHGWHLRQEITWHKTRSMPEAVRDRPARSQESIFLLSPGPKYYYDLNAVREPSGAALKSVWAIAPTNHKIAHTAVFPPELPRRAIMLGTSERGACSSCGAPYARATKRVGAIVDGRPFARKVQNRVEPGSSAAIKQGVELPEYKTTGWRKPCRCSGDSVRPCVVLDPFAGSGTTLAVAAEVGRDWLGVEIEERYGRLISERVG